MRIEKDENYKKYYIIFSLLLFSFATTFVDLIVHPNYFVKISIKIILFILIPSIYFIIFKKEAKDLKNIFKFNTKGILLSIFLGILIFATIIGGYFLTNNLFDYSNVSNNLTSGMGITKSNFMYVAIYITIINSFLEEFFFREFGFIELKKQTNVKFANLFSSICFAIYHVGMSIGSFKLVLLIIIILALVFAGIIFNTLIKKYKNIYIPWIVHIFTDAAIMIVGTILFNVN